MVLVEGNTDFTPISEDIVYDRETANGTECFSVSVVNDEVLENDENFRVVLQTSNDAVIEFVNSVILVTVVDNDGELVACLGGCQ